jgi:hypothetical protein
MRLTVPLAFVVALALALSGCGGSGEEVTRSGTATENPAAVIQAKWEHSLDCQRPAGASRWGCSVGSYRCQAVVVDRGWSVSCARPGESISFLVRP